VKGFESKVVETGNARFTLYEPNGMQRLDHLDALNNIAKNSKSTGSVLKDFILIDLEIQWQLVAQCYKGPRWWIPKWLAKRKVKKLGTSVLNDLYLASCTLSNIPTPEEVQAAEKKIQSPLQDGEPVEE
jgi:hypothetical protein